MDKTSIRPEIPLVVQGEDPESLKFQNATLRPILKLQNDLLVRLFFQYLDKRKQLKNGTWLNEQESTQKAAFIKKVVTTDQRLKQYLLGVVVGHFTTEEAEVYLAMESEINKRIWTMMIERLIDNLAKPKEEPLF